MATTPAQRAKMVEVFPTAPTIGNVIEWIEKSPHPVYPSMMQSIPHFPTHDYASQIWSDAITIHRAKPSVRMQTALDAALFGSYAGMEDWCKANGVSFDNIRDQLLRTTGADESAIEDVFSPVDLCAVTTLEMKLESELTKHQTTVKSAVHTEFARRIKRRPFSPRHPFAVVRHLATLQFSELVTSKIEDDKRIMIQAATTEDAAVEGWIPADGSPCKTIHDGCRLHTEDWKRLRRLQLSLFGEMERVDLLAILYVWMRVANHRMKDLVVSADAYKDHMRKYTLLSIERLNQTNECNSDLYVYLFRDVMNLMRSQFMNTLKADATRIATDGKLQNIEHEVLQGLAMGAHVLGKPAPTLASVLQEVGFDAKDIEDVLEGTWQAIYASIQTNLSGASSASATTGTKRKKPQGSDSTSSSSRVKSRPAPETPEVPTLDSGSSEEETKQSAKKARQSKLPSLFDLQTKTFKENMTQYKKSKRALEKNEETIGELIDERESANRPTSKRLTAIESKLKTLETEREEYRKKYIEATTQLCNQYAEAIKNENAKGKKGKRLDTRLEKLGESFNYFKGALKWNLANHVPSAGTLPASLPSAETAAAANSTALTGPTTNRKRKAATTHAAASSLAASSAAASSAAASSAAAPSAAAPSVVAPSAAAPSAAASSAAASSAAASSAAASSAAASSAAAPSAAAPSAAALSAAAPSAVASSTAAPSAATSSAETSNKRQRIETLTAGLTVPEEQPWSFFAIPDRDGTLLCDTIREEAVYIATILRNPMSVYAKNAESALAAGKPGANVFATRVSLMGQIGKWPFLPPSIDQTSLQLQTWRDNRNRTWCSVLDETCKHMKDTTTRVSALDLIRIWKVVRGITDTDPPEMWREQIRQIIGYINVCATQIGNRGNDSNEWYVFFVIRSAILRWINELLDPTVKIQRTENDPDVNTTRTSETHAKSETFQLRFPYQIVKANAPLPLIIQWMMAEACMIQMTRLRLPLTGAVQVQSALSAGTSQQSS